MITLSGSFFRWRRMLAAGCVGMMALFLLAAPLRSLAQSDSSRQIGQMARENAEELAGKPVPGAEQAAETDLTGMIAVTGLLLVVAFILVGVLFNYVARLTGFAPFANWKPNPINARIFLAFFIVAAVLLVWEYGLHSRYVLLGDAASAHGEELDRMMTTTLIITAIVFVITQTLLFLFSYLYRGRAGRVASFYHDNTRLELWWTVIPAIVLAYLVIDGIGVWRGIHQGAEGKEPVNVELVAEQFQWHVRYAGEDNKLGRANYKLIGGENVLGVDFADAAARNDLILPDKEIIVPVNRPVRVNIRAKDVLHGVYMPYFRVQMYAVPGMPTQFEFTPIATTAQARKASNNPEFEYEMACSQLCGAGHYNMRAVVTVVSEAEYDAWLKQQTPYYTQLQQKNTNQTPESTTGTTDNDDNPAQPGEGQPAPDPKAVTPRGEATRPISMR